MSAVWEKPCNRPELNLDGVHVWRAQLIASATEVDVLSGCLSLDERERADRFAHAKHRARFVVARGVLRQLLGRYLGLDPAELGFDYGEHGKPALSSGELQFNMSHSHEMALYAIALDRQIGVDIEWPRTTVAYDHIAARFFSVREQAALAERPEIERRAAFYNIWTRKEAYLKARGDGISAGLDTFCVSSDAEARLLHSDAGATELARWKMTALTPAPGYVAALCAVGDWRLNCYAWSD